LQAVQQVGRNGDEDSRRGGQSVSKGVSEGTFYVMAAPCGADVARGEDERLAERNGTQILHIESAGHGDDAACAIGLAHGLVEEGRDDASVRVSRRTGETAGETEAADDVQVGIDEEAKAQAGRVLEPAAEAAIQGTVGEGREGGWKT
jgi:hypothetical protein